MSGTLTTQLAWRYLRGKRTGNAVPILSRISMVAIAVSAAAMIIVFSVFNGLEGFVKDLYKGFYPDLRITVARGTYFSLHNGQMKNIKAIEGIDRLTTVIEGNAIVNNERNNEQKVIMLKGIDNTYLQVNDIRDFITGEDTVSMGNPYTAIGGVRILNDLGADINNIFSTIQIYYANPEQTNLAEHPESIQLHPAGLFNVSDDFDDKYILAPLPLVQKLFHKDGRYSSIEIKLKPGAEDAVRNRLQQLLGGKYVVENRFEQNKTMFMVMRTEKWVIYAILVMVLLVASVNLIGALSMLVLEKQKDIAILKAMGALPATVTRIFLLEGILWALTGGIIGMLLGAIVCVLQQHFGFVTVNGAFLMDAYPVDMNLSDFVLVTFTIIAVGALGAWYPARRAAKASIPALKTS